MLNFEQLSSLEQLDKQSSGNLVTLSGLKPLEDAQENRPHPITNLTLISSDERVGHGNPSFENLYDDNTAKFLKECTGCGVELHPSTNLCLNDENNDTVERYYNACYR